MVNTLRERLVEKWNHSEEEAKRRVVRFDIQKTEELIHGSWSEESKKIYEKDNASLVVNGGLRSVVGEQPVDLIIGGPPCQAYSIAGRAQSPTKMQDDYRNYLFESYAKVVDHFKPKLFVFENVPGLLTACPGGKPVKNRIFEAFEEIGYEIRNPADLKNAVYCAEDFDVPQKRNRVIILGIKKGLNLNLDDFYSALNREKKSSKKTVKDAIGNLPELIPTGKVEKVGRVHVSHKQTCEELVENHTPRYHGFRDQKLFREWLSNSMNSFSSEEKKEFYIPKQTREKNLYGTEFEIKLRNEMTQKAIAKECADWIRRKVTFKSNTTGENMGGFITVENQDDNYTYMPINGFTTVDIGCERGNNAYNIVNRFINPVTKEYLKTFEQNKEFADDLERQLQKMLFPNLVLKDKEGNPVQVEVKASKKKVNDTAEAPEESAL